MDLIRDETEVQFRTANLPVNCTRVDQNNISGQLLHTSLRHTSMLCLHERFNRVVTLDWRHHVCVSCPVLGTVLQAGGLRYSCSRCAPRYAHGISQLQTSIILHLVKPNMTTLLAEKHREKNHLSV